MKRRSEIVSEATRATYRSVRQTKISEAHASCMCRLLSFEICVHVQYRTGCLEKCLRRPPAMWRQEWHDSVYAARRLTLTSRMMLPRPRPVLNAETAS